MQSQRLELLGSYFRVLMQIQLVLVIAIIPALTAGSLGKEKERGTLFALFGMREARADAAAKTLSSGDTLDRRTHDRHLARGDVEHAFDGA